MAMLGKPQDVLAALTIQFAPEETGETAMGSGSAVSN